MITFVSSNAITIAISAKAKKSLAKVIPAILFPKLSEVEPDVLMIENDKKFENSR
ncbi:hypothetical protein LANSK_18500 [Lactobacillus amylovorus subsp. amylovorus]|uniref:Uncharacterized protein n=1 Tax=Lactobacillus amylovorus subsp. animalium TaxID=3378536 RepID=A0ABD0C311_LACAM|nr:hypothetical protein LABF186_07900 [Lactobacillus amylovorus]GMM15788.1 hypothetical protein LABF125_09210 [Lactobacillus amylovorus]GMM18361.1 hypothetical protein LAYK3_14800 [Lactobacillus amylovorus]GMM20196.1 hypothetical protein LAYK6_14110 [Lactobacillus amylovorus]GMM22162.1 hypothetical protein LAYK10_14740 [Lactobacillus amylovorus]